MAKKRDWKKVGEIAAKIRELGLSYKDGAKRFGIKPWLLYDYNRKKGDRDTSEASVSAKVEPAKDEASKDTAPSAALPGDVGDLIRAYRQAHPDHGSLGSACPVFM